MKVGLVGGRLLESGDSATSEMSCWAGAWFPSGMIDMSAWIIWLNM